MHCKGKIQQGKAVIAPFKNEHKTVKKRKTGCRYALIAEERIECIHFSYKKPRHA